MPTTERTPEILYDALGYRIERYHTSKNTRGLIYTFTPFMFKKIDSLGFGVAFLLSEGFDVVSFKCINDSWFQKLPRDTIENVAKIGSDYSFIASYGSSMGGFAAIAFSDLLQVKYCIAISPQFSITQDFDRRWHAQAEKIENWNFNIAPGGCKGTDLVLVYDDTLEKDRIQVEHIKSTLSPRSVREIRASLSGHPTGYFLTETSQISSFISSLLKLDLNINIEFKWSKVKKSRNYMSSLGRYALQKDRLKLSTLAFSQAIKLAPDNIGYRMQISQPLHRLGRTPDAIDHIKHALSLNPDNLQLRRRLLLLTGNDTE